MRLHEWSHCEKCEDLPEGVGKTATRKNTGVPDGRGAL